MADGLHIALISVHGLIRGEEPELGRDADTGGQVIYVLQLARALARHPKVARVELLTRLVEDPKVGPDYARPREELAPGATLVRLPCGPRRYLRKESLWPHLEAFADAALRHFRELGRPPDVLHGHYADAGEVAAMLSGSLGVPMVQTGHSLGRVKRERLLARGLSEESIEKRFRISRRIEAEEVALDNASLVVASTWQEVEEQYALYAGFDRECVKVIPPSVDLERFAPPRRGESRPPIAAAIDRFLREPRKPLILALSRADHRKNLEGLVEAYAGDPKLQELANLAIVAGNRDDIRELDKEARTVLTELLLAVDRHDLWGKVALPKHHDPEDVPDLYRLAARRRGVFVNPALTEPFGLTLLEAAASGLPVVATADGGPRDILGHCENGVLVDPLDPAAMGRALRESIADRGAWKRRARAGLRGVHEHYTWDAHAKSYVKALEEYRPGGKPLLTSFDAPLVTARRLLVCDIDNTLTDDREGAERFGEAMRRAHGRLAFGVATGRHLELALEELERWGIPVPDVILSSVGTEIHYGRERRPDHAWARHIDHRWDAQAVREALADVDGLELQGPEGQQRFKVSYFVDEDRWPSLPALRARLRERGVRARLVASHGHLLDVLPLRASKGHAVRYVAMRWGLAPHEVITAGDSGNDVEMLRGNTLGIVVGNHAPELEKLRGDESIHFASAQHAAGVLEGLAHYGEDLSAAPAAGHDEQAGGLETGA